MAENSAGSWGWLSDVEGYGKPGDTASDFEKLEYVTALDLKDYMHAAHGMILAKDKSNVFDLYPKKGAILMQMRFDGCLGFPGGLVDKDGESPVEALNRELEEEIGLDLDKYMFTKQDHVVSHKNQKKTLVTHFFAKEVTLAEFTAIEKKTLDAFDYGRETLGPIQVPLFTMGDGYRGLPIFLANQFAGNARQQLLIGIKTFQLLSDNEIKTALEAFKNYTNRH